MPHSPRLKVLLERWEGLCATPIDHRLQWMAGLGSAVWGRFKQAIEQASGGTKGVLEVLFPSESQDGGGLVVVGSCQAPLMFGCLAPKVEEEDLLALAKLQIAAYEPGRDLVEIDGLAEPTETDRWPWEQGYQLAEALMASLGSTLVPIDLEELCCRLGVQVQSVELSDPEIRGVAFVGADQRPTIAVNTTHQANTHLFGQRFTLAHELCHLLYDRDRARALALASGPWTSADIEKRANAFAAMLLIPTPAVRAWVAQHGPLEDRDAVRKLAEELQVGFQATLRHLTNLDFLSPAQRQTIDAED